MTDAKHTPGEWSAHTEVFKSARDVLDDLERMLWAGGERNFTITTVRAADTLPTPPPEWSNGQVVVAYLGNGPTAATNARLIAAAPDLLAACEGFLLRMDGGYINITDDGAISDEATETTAALRAAIAKAKGPR